MWINEVGHAKPSVIQSVRLTEKGLVVTAIDYSCFMWRNDKLRSHLLEALTQWIDGNGQEIQVVPKPKEKRGYTIEPTGKEQAWYLDPTTFTYSSESIGDNPFLKDSSPSPQNPILGTTESPEGQPDLSTRSPKTSKRQS